MIDREQIIERARASGGADITSNGYTSWVGTQTTEFLERFAELVASDERQACAKVCEDQMNKWPFGVREQVCAKAIRARSGETK